MAKTVTITIPLEGISTGKRTPIVETDGFAGEACKNASEAFTKAFSSGPVMDETLKSEFYETEQRQEFLNQGG